MRHTLLAYDMWRRVRGGANKSGWPAGRTRAYAKVFRPLIIKTSNVLFVRVVHCMLRHTMPTMKPDEDPSVRAQKGVGAADAVMFNKIEY